MNAVVEVRLIARALRCPTCGGELVRLWRPRVGKGACAVPRNVCESCKIEIHMRRLPVNRLYETKTAATSAARRETKRRRERWAKRLQKMGHP